MEYIEVSPLPEVCRRCEDRRSCLEKNEPEWCCDECDYLLERFVPAAADAKTGLSQNEAFPEVREIIFIKIAQAAERGYCL